MKEFKISEDLLQATINYLGTKPYQEVVVLLEALRTLIPIEKEVEPQTEVK